ncbi:IPTL-CTERM sorting domain-containing protein [Comamonas piscis]|uniref:IPTL-CTERM sorting domain-containing protein n=1 Tax=Comamonas piscis TaxID=1562974 RepID=A0A7G5EJE9_9BURK|nr:IPTL-CTERM sorting domain-containing protein [Comamonas piscis]QMV74124.1 IPTL-CTERM sorting domain-containing protein [Comamonas piscis]WSO32564.1 IPTL-CTERM sorting domain-containing protein [Comamonas piscis]
MLSLPSALPSRTKPMGAFFVPLALSMALATSAVNAQSIDTTTTWDGSSSVSSFGLPNTATYGQTIMAPTLPAKLQAFEIRINPQGMAFPFKFYVYEWDPVAQQATGPQMYASAVQTTEAVSVFQTYAVSDLNVTLVPGKSYVLFASVSETPGPVASSRWGSVDGGSYADGQFVFVNNSGNPSAWTSQQWTTNWNGGIDLAFKAGIFYVGAPVAPMLSLDSTGDSRASFGLSLSDSGAAPLQQYNLSCSPQGDGAVVTGSGSTSTLTLIGLVNGTTYDCTATATNGDGLTGPASNIVAVTPRAAPAAPTPVPTLSEWGTMLLSALVAGLGILGMSRASRRHR